MKDSKAPKESLWNSLEFAKIVVGILTPAAIFYFTLLDNQRQTEQSESKASVVRQETQERERFVQVTKLRIALWSEISPLMNDLYCYFLYVGHWKEIAPEQVIATKRKLDRLISSNRPFFSPDFLKKYDAFMSSAFKTGTGWGEDAKLRSRPIRVQDKGREQMFERKDAKFFYNFVDNAEAIHIAYYDWLAYAAKEMDLVVEQPSKPGVPPQTGTNKGN
ncbi:hypothetical protein PS862_02879 [Pseudomonas fluorescens]|uniref:Transmembrane protein n=1 Tax=Pseudomonas fluorescens TaxID=294 RepID=A0A5E7L0Z7_PSEFL|nr:hypothetical protein [Pseudomonas fluorescens]VVP01644.1 hypothetical protein PS862_02879 [Pseudomonas fluorescens]